MKKVKKISKWAFYSLASACYLAILYGVAKDLLKVITGFFTS